VSVCVIITLYFMLIHSFLFFFSLDLFTLVDDNVVPGGCSRLSAVSLDTSKSIEIKGVEEKELTSSCHCVVLKDT